MMIKNEKIILNNKTEMKHNTINLISDPAILQFYKVKELIIYYSSFKKVDTKRDVSNELISVVQPFYDLAGNIDVFNKIEFIIKNHTRSDTEICYKNKINNEAKKINNEGFKYLAIREDITLAYLKKCYRKASKKHHPDLGGSTKIMQIINEAYTQFHQLICEYKCLRQSESYDDINPIFTKEFIKDSNDFFLQVGLILVEVYTDIMAVDFAYSTLIKIQKHGLLNSIRSKSKIIGYIEVFVKLSTRLRAANLNQQSKHIFKLVEEGCELAKKNGLNYQSFPGLLSRKINSNKKPSIIIKHSIQAENAYRLKIIDEMKYSAYLEKFNSITNEFAVKQKKLSDYLKRNNFIKDLGIYPTEKLREKPKKRIPEPDYYTLRYEHLNNQQQIEYLHTFYDITDLASIEKYKWIRLGSYFIAIIKNFNNVDKLKIIDECNFLGELFGDENYKLVQELYEFLHYLKECERTEKINLLTELDSDEKQVLNILIGLQDPHTFPIEPSRAYIDFVMLPNDRIKLYKKTGNFKNKEEKLEERKAISLWNRDNRMLTNFNKTKIGRNYNNTIFETNKIPENVIEVVLPYVTKALELSEKFDPNHTGELQLGYSINELTIAYAKLKKWQEVNYWIELFFSLPIRFGDRSPNSEREKLRKRLNRSLKYLK